MTTNVGMLRWMLKKVSRTAVARGSSLLADALPRGLAATSRPVRALTYHRFGLSPRDPFCVSAEAFAAQMQELAKRGLAVSLAQLKSFLAGEVELPRDAVLVTVDDGFQSLRSVALPILRHFAIPAVAFVSAGLVRTQTGKGPIHADPEQYLSWRDLELLVQHGVSIQSHGLTHRSLGRLALREARIELVRSRHLLQGRLGLPVDAFAYPFGTRADFNPAIARLVSEAGYQIAFTSQHGAIQRDGDLHTLPRTKVESGETVETFVSLVQGGLDAWRWIDRGLWRLQASRGAR
jgi:peptidoglycan/xylan/chitin deacetylase (PgdA/CDA1 family)